MNKKSMEIFTYGSKNGKTHQKNKDIYDVKSKKSRKKYSACCTIEVYLFL